MWRPLYKYQKKWFRLSFDSIAKEVEKCEKNEKHLTV